MNGDLWEKLWAETDADALFARLERYCGLKSPIIDVFKGFGASRVCDAACGLGAYSVAFASNGFEVYSFDVSPTAAQIARRALEHFGLDSSRVKAADILSTGYPDAFFDGVIAGSVLDHMRVADAKSALAELRRITRPGGLVMASFDRLDEDDLSLPHERLADGSILYTSGRRRGMILRPYSEVEARRLLGGLEIVYAGPNPQGEQVFIAKNSERAEAL